MYGRISTLAFVGIEARPVEVQVRISSGRHMFAIVGLPDKAVAESRERVRNALHAVGLGLPYRHITVNLAPADLPKEGSSPPPKAFDKKVFFMACKTPCKRHASGALRLAGFPVPGGAAYVRTRHASAFALPAGRSMGPALSNSPLSATQAHPIPAPCPISHTSRDAVLRETYRDFAARRSRRLTLKSVNSDWVTAFNGEGLGSVEDGRPRFVQARR